MAFNKLPTKQFPDGSPNTNDVMVQLQSMNNPVSGDDMPIIPPTLPPLPGNIGPPPTNEDLDSFKIGDFSGSGASVTSDSQSQNVMMKLQSLKHRVLLNNNNNNNNSVSIDNPSGGYEGGDMNYKQNCTYLPPPQQEQDVAERELSSSRGMSGDLVCTNNIPKIDEILMMNPIQARAEVNKINKGGKKLLVQGNLPTLKVRIYDYYYPPGKETVTVYLSTGQITSFKAEKLNDTCCTVTMVEDSTTMKKGPKGLVTVQSLGVGSNIVSINNEPLTAQYSDGQPVMTMACKLFNGDISNTNPKFIRVVPAVPVSNNTDNNKRKRASDAPSSNPKSRATKAPKRIKVKCSAPNCENNVVQGGVCILHGAKRKLCSHPGCNKAVKSAGACSAHGPARKKCDKEGCTRVAVQGGKCIAHGAKKGVGRSGGRPKSQSRVQNKESYCIPVGSESVATKKIDTPSEKDDGVLPEEESKIVDGGKQLEVAGNTEPNGMYTQSSTATPHNTDHHAQLGLAAMAEDDKKPAAAPSIIDLINTNAKSGIDKPGPNDVMSGRGVSLRHLGNIKFRRIVEGMKPSYKAAARGNKLIIAMKIVSDWRVLNPPGRFLMLNKQTGLWDDIGDEEARKSTSQKLREKEKTLLSEDGKDIPKSNTEAFTPAMAKTTAPSDVSADKKFACPHCSTGFLTQPGLDYHVKNTHQTKKNGGDVQFVVDDGKQTSLPTDDGSKQPEVAGNTKPNGVYTQSSTTPHNKSSTEAFTPAVAKTAAQTSAKPVAVTTSSPLRNHQNKALSSPLPIRDLEKEEADKEPKGNTTNQGSGDKENDVGSNDNDGKVESSSGESNTAIDTELLSFSEAVEASNEDNLLKAWTDMFRNNTPKHVKNLLGLAQKELDKSVGSSDEGLLLAEKEKAEADKKRFEKKMESYVQDAMELDNVDENGKADMRGNKNYEACEKKVNELEGKLSVINAKLGNKKIIVNRLKEKFDNTFENIVKDVSEWWTGNRNDEPTFLVAEKTKWNDFWGKVMGI